MTREPRVRKAPSLVDALAVAALQLAVRADGLVGDQVGAGDARLRQPVAVVDLEWMKREVNYGT